MNKQILQTWLLQQSRLLPGSRRALMLFDPAADGQFQQRLCWPEDSTESDELDALIATALNRKQTVIETADPAVADNGKQLDRIACPIEIAGQVSGVVVFVITGRSKNLQQVAVQHIQLGLKWLETILTVNQAGSREQLTELLELLTTALSHDKVETALSQLATELAIRFSCNRVSIGFLHFNRMQIDALSHSQQIDRQSRLLSLMRDTMNEALDQQSSISYPEQSEDQIQTVFFHQQLAEELNGCALCTVPLIQNGTAIGAILFERSQEHPFAAETIKQLEQSALLLGPILHTRIREERPLPLKTYDSFRSLLKKLFGKGYPRVKAVAAAAAIALLWLSLASGPCHISSEAVLEASVCRVIVAPQNGYLESSNVRPGDLVRKGEVLATLDDQELRQQRRGWLTQREQLAKEYRQALAGFDRAAVTILNAKKRQIETQLQLVDQQLSRTRLTAPLTGVVIKGDVSQNLGSPVERGEVLFEVAPTDRYRVVIKVDDRDIRLFSVGQSGQLRLASLPDRPLPIRIERITPVASVENRRNFFRVEADLSEQSDLLRPGMAGISKIDIGEQKKIWIWSRRLVEWLQLQLWHWLP